MIAFMMKSIIRVNFKCDEFASYVVLCYMIHQEK